MLPSARFVRECDDAEHVQQDEGANGGHGGGTHAETPGGEQRARDDAAVGDEVLKEAVLRKPHFELRGDQRVRCAGDAPEPGDLVSDPIAEHEGDHDGEDRDAADVKRKVQP